MTTLTRTSLIAAALFGVAAIGPIMNRHSGVSSAQGQAPTPVSISSPLPVPVSMPALIDHGRNAYQSIVNNDGLCSGTLCTFSFGTVPANHRLVVERVSGTINFAAAPTTANVQLNNSTTDLDVFLLSNLRAPMFNEAVESYFDAGQPVNVVVSISGTTFNTGSGYAQIIKLSGYELDCSAAACSPIATR